MPDHVRGLDRATSRLVPRRRSAGGVQRSERDPGATAGQAALLDLQRLAGNRAAGSAIQRCGGIPPSACPCHDDH